MKNIVRHGGPNISPAARAKRPAGRSNHRTEVRIARGFDDLLMVYTIRAAVYMAEQDCPFVEEFDGNDHCATHFLGLVDGEPAGCLRVRFFADFCKVERLAVRKNYRRSIMVRSLIREGFNHCRRKGYTKFYAHAREGLEPFWAYFGAKPLPGQEKFVFSDHLYTEMVGEFEPIPDSISLKSGPMVILRPEGDWDRPGVLEFSSMRMPRKPIENSVTTGSSMGQPA
jgi:predicted GNAT family N-acyltransferase